MDEYVMHDGRNYQNAPMIKFRMNVIFYTFHCVGN